MHWDCAWGAWWRWQRDEYNFRWLCKDREELVSARYHLVVKHNIHQTQRSSLVNNNAQETEDTCIPMGYLELKVNLSRYVLSWYSGLESRTRISMSHSSKLSDSTISIPGGRDSFIYGCMLRQREHKTYLFGQQRVSRVWKDIVLTAENATMRSKSWYKKCLLLYGPSKAPIKRIH